MRLLQLEDNGEFSLTKDLVGDDIIPPYAILSHTWGPDDEEVTFDDLTNGTGKDRPGYRKIHFCGKQAANDGLLFFWVDTCCIDKSSSAELSEAINSMFQWYHNAARCYVYLSDVSAGTSRWKTAFKESKWFTRGWTLQELVAPVLVEFFSVEGERLGDKISLEQTLHEITGIAIRALRGSPLAYFSTDERMSWAAKRQTRRREDAAYSLLGIFNIHMPLIYGEGGQKALGRLLKEIKDNNSINLPIAEGASFDSHAEEHSARCLRGTRVELLDQVMKWAKDMNSKPIFWLNGMAGTGKSTIARSVAQLLADNGQLGASFFFKKGEGERSNASRFFTTIITDLMGNVPGLVSGIRKALNTDPAIAHKALKDQFEKLILQPLSQAAPLNALRLTIVIDALDECERDEDIRAILQLLSQTKGLKPVSLQVFVTSRPELPVRLGFKKMPDGTYQDLILHEVPRSTIEHDITLFLEHQLGEIREQHSLSTDWPGRDRIQALANMTIPLFIFAATVCRYVGSKGSDPEEYLNKVLDYQKSTFSQLDQTYLPILNQLLDSQEEEDKEMWLCGFQELVGSIIILESPLSIASLEQLLKIQRERIRCRLNPLHSILSIPDSDDVPIRLLHLSFRDFLVNPLKKGKSPFWVNERETHEKLASKCLKLLLEGLRQDICELQDPGTPRSEIDEQTIAICLPPELQYACRHWVHHLEQSDHHIHDGDPTHLFLQKYFLYWLEALSLIGEAYKCIYIIKRLQAITKSSISAVSRFLHDAERFTLRFRSILEEAPLQVYSSALIFAPEKSIIRKTFAVLIPEWVDMISNVENNWDACRSTFEGHAKPVNALAFSPDSQLVVSASMDRTVQLLERATGSCHSTFEGHSDWVNAVAFSPDGQLVASASNDKTVRLWEVVTGSCYSTFKGHSDQVNAVAFSPDGQLVASASNDRTVRLWETATDSCRSILGSHSNYIRAVAFSPDGQLVASASDNTVWIWETAIGSRYRKLKGHSLPVNAIAFSPDGQLVASVSDDSTVRLWETATSSCHNILEGHFSIVNAVAFSPDGHLVASASNDKTVRLWETTTGSCYRILERFHYSTPRNYYSSFASVLAFSPNGQLIASTFCEDSIVWLWETATGSCHNILEGHSSNISAVAFSPDGQLVASASGDWTVRLWEIGTGYCHSILKNHSLYINAVAFSPDGQLVASASNDKTVWLWETATGSCFRILEGHSNCIMAVAFSPDSQLVASTSDDRTVRLWEVVTGSCCSTLEGHFSYISTVVFSPDSRLVASASIDKTVRLWEIATASCLRILEGHSSYITVVAFSPDGLLVASASDDKTVRLWEVVTGSYCSTLEGHSSYISAVAFSPDSRLVASASGDNTIRLWETATGSCLSTLKGHFGYISEASFSPDGRYLQTNEGQISLSLPSSSISSPQIKRPLDLSVLGHWVALGRKSLLWIPPEYRATCTAVHKDLVCLGHSYGHVTILRIHPEFISP